MKRSIGASSHDPRRPIEHGVTAHNRRLRSSASGKQPFSAVTKHWGGMHNRLRRFREGEQFGSVGFSGVYERDSLSLRWISRFVWTEGGEETTDWTEGTDRHRPIRGHPYCPFDPRFLFSIFGLARPVRHSEFDAEGCCNFGWTINLLIDCTTFVGESDRHWGNIRSFPAGPSSIGFYCLVQSGN